MAMEDRETFSLIGSDKVEGTNVYGANGEKVGYIERVMIDKALKYDANLGATSPASPTTSSAAPPNTPTRGVGIGATRRPHAP